jgi:hypothetical protein
MEGIQLVSTILKLNDEIVDEELDDVLVELHRL